MRDPIVGCSGSLEAAAGPRPLVLGAEWFGDRPGGMNRYVRDLLAALEAAGTAPLAVLLGPADGAPADIVRAGRADQFLPTRLLAFTRAASRVAAQVDVVDAHFALYAALPVTVSRLRRLPLVVHFHGPWADESEVSSPSARRRALLKRWIELLVYRRADRLVVLSEAFHQVLIDRYGIAPWAIRIIPPTVDLQRFRPAADLEGDRRSLGLPESAFIAVVARRLEPRMGLDVLIDAWADVVARRPDAVLAIVGAGKLRHELEQRSLDAGLAGSVRFLGRISDEMLATAYRAADVSVVPTVALEGFGLVVLESLASGTPVIVTDVGGLPETVAGLEEAMVVPAGDPNALAAAILAVAAGGGPSPSACRRHAERFSPSALARRSLETYTAAVAARPRALFIDHCAQRSGGELALARLLPALDVHSHVILGEDGPLVGLLREQGSSCEVLPLGVSLQGIRKDDVRPGRLPLSGAVAGARSVLTLRRRIRQLRPDVVHTNSLKAALYGGVAARLAGVPVVWHIRDRIAPDYLPPSAVRLVRVLARRLPTAVIANSNATLETLGPLRCPSYVIPSPVAPLPAAEPEGSGGPSDRPLVIGMVGRIAPWKGQHVFLEAFARAFPHGGAEAVVVGGALFGEQDYEDHLRQLAHTPGLEGRVRLTGHLDDVTPELRRFDILVHASVVPEPFGQVVVEGLSAGVPVVAARAGGPTDTITDGTDGILYPPGDVDALATVLLELAADPERRASLSSAGRRRAQAFLPDVVAPAVLDVYRNVIG